MSVMVDDDQTKALRFYTEVLGLSPSACGPRSLRRTWGWSPRRCFGDTCGDLIQIAAEKS